MAPVLSFLLPYVLAVATGGAVGRFFHLPSLIGVVSLGYILSAVNAPSNIVPSFFLASAHPQARLIYDKNKGFAYQLAPLLPAALFFFTAVVYIRSPERMGRGIGYAVFGMTTALALMAFHFSKELGELADAASVRIFRAGLVRRFAVASGFACASILVFFYTVFYSLSDDKSVLFLDPFRVFGQARFQLDPFLLLRFLGLAAALLAVNAPRLLRRRSLLGRADLALISLCSLAWAAAVGSVTFFVYVMGTIQGSRISMTAFNFMAHHLLALVAVLAGWTAVSLSGRAPAVTDLRQPTWTFRKGAGAAWTAVFVAGFVGSLYYTESSWYSVAAALALFAAVAVAMSSRKRLEDIVQERTFDLNAEKEKVDALLQNILPAYVIEDLKARGRSEPRSFQDIAVMFTDFVGFTRQSTLLSPEALIEELNEMFTAFDSIVARHGGERIKTIGDGYMAVAGLRAGGGDPAASLVECAKEVLAYLEGRRRPGKPEWRIRIGIAAGATVGGVVGRTKYLFDLFGDTVNTASRMESNSLPMRINVSEAVYQRLKGRFEFEERPPIEVKGKGPMKMYFLKS